MNISKIAIKVLEWFLHSCKENKVKIPFKWKITIMLVIGFIKAGKFMYFLSNILKNIDIDIDERTKTWKITPKGYMFQPVFQKRYYDDIDAIMKSNPELYKEWRLSNTNIIIDTDPNATL